ncbi:hypothetical protein K470DRAFT_210726 [Piedraia hortae CBS 480.64]|uniref:Uncharacterized protein n=1 Tax=Piedraia hortae CBS 480.64 TaxID=1314780 RepID=A0A6A7C7B1_9PEZI|nr:hypothetical protein K470DRAFT_210726 [Piedraia hortae CBS 480.64]
MAPIRRYLRIARYTVLEVRIYVEQPKDKAWLESSSVLPRVLEAVRPHVLPKLRDESTNAHVAGKKRKKIRDLASGEEFDVTIHLANHSRYHSVLTKRKELSDPAPRIKSTSSKLTGTITIDDDDQNPQFIEYDNEDKGELPGTRDGDEDDGAKKMKMTTFYDGFSIYGRVLCLVVQRRAAGAHKTVLSHSTQMMEQWINTQPAQEASMDDDDD